MLKFLQQLIGVKKRKEGHYLGLAFSPSGIEFSHLCNTNNSSQPSLIATGFSACEKPSAFNKACLSPLIQANKLQGLPTYITLSSQYYQLMLVDAPDVEDDELTDAVKWRVKDLISEDLDEVIVDAFRLAKDAYRGRMNMIYAAIIDKKMVQDLVQLIESCDLNLQSIGINELSSCAYTQFMPAISDTGIALVTLGEHDGMINLTENGKLYLSRNISVGLQELGITEQTSAVQNSTDNTLTLDDELTTDENLEFNDIPEAVLNNTISEANVEADIIDNLALDIQRSLDYYESQLGKSAISRIVFLPTQDLSSIIPALNKQLPCVVEQLQINALIDTTENTRQPTAVFSIGSALAAFAASEKKPMGTAHV
ncbi:MAG: hypothetical protein HRU20_08475 [Pseudomonadales bacterium]|nr:hypothetical protein [Pseudomonadales bacterium]